jgi:uncharacterized protein YneF (UPF0154 family)
MTSFIQVILVLLAILVLLVIAGVLLACYVSFKVVDKVEEEKNYTRKN